MARYLIALVAVIACSIVTTTAFGGQKGFYIGGGIASMSPSGDLDGKSVLVNSDGDRFGAVGKLDGGGGLQFDIGYNFGKHFGLEYLQTVTVHVAKHQNEVKETDAIVSTGLLGFRLSAGMADAFDVFARAGLAAASVTYERYGHKGTFSPYAPTSDEDFTISGSGAGYGLGAEAIFGKHLGVAIGYTVYNVKFDRGHIGDSPVTIDKKQPSATFTTTDVSVLWHF